MKSSFVKICVAAFLLLFLSGCEKKVAIDEEALTLIDTYLKDDKVKAFHPRLQMSRANVLEDFEKRYKETFLEDVKVSLEYDEKTYDSDFENSVKVVATAKQPLRILFKTPFIKDSITVEKQASKTYKVKGVSQSNLSVEILKILPPTDEYKTKIYAP
jgi:hypothetical protein